MRSVRASYKVSSFKVLQSSEIPKPSLEAFFALAIWSLPKGKHKRGTA